MKGFNTENKRYSKKIKKKSLTVDSRKSRVKLETVDTTMSYTRAVLRNQDVNPGSIFLSIPCHKYDKFKNNLFLK
jgi:hypothetical protein